MREFLTVEYRLPRWGESSRPHSSGERRRRHAHGAQLIDGEHGVAVGKIEPFAGRRDVQNVEAGSAERAGGRLVHGRAGPRRASVRPERSVPSGRRPIPRPKGHPAASTASGAPRSMARSNLLQISAMSNCALRSELWTLIESQSAGSCVNSLPSVQSDGVRCYPRTRRRARSPTAWLTKLYPCGEVRCNAEERPSEDIAVPVACPMGRETRENSGESQRRRSVR